MAQATRGSRGPPLTGLLRSLPPAPAGMWRRGRWSRRRNTCGGPGRSRPWGSPWPGWARLGQPTETPFEPTSGRAVLRAATLPWVAFPSRLVNQMQKMVGLVFVALLVGSAVDPLVAIPFEGCKQGADSDCCAPDCAMCLCCVHWLPVLPEARTARPAILRAEGLVADVSEQLPSPHPHPILHVPRPAPVLA